MTKPFLSLYNNSLFLTLVERNDIMHKTLRNNKPSIMGSERICERVQHKQTGQNLSKKKPLYHSTNLHRYQGRIQDFGKGGVQVTVKY